jgi:hypothetical protein
VSSRHPFRHGTEALRIAAGLVTGIATSRQLFLRPAGVERFVLAARLARVVSAIASQVAAPVLGKGRAAASAVAPEVAGTGFR